MNDVKIEKLTVKENSKVFGGAQRGFSPCGTTGEPSVDTCCCCCACVPDPEEPVS